ALKMPAGCRRSVLKFLYVELGGLGRSFSHQSSVISYQLSVISYQLMRLLITLKFLNVKLACQVLG
ncbi:MAG: hypothetical protein WCP55_08350, partial [Lentisphaerota bacterium]